MFKVSFLFRLHSSVRRKLVGNDEVVDTLTDSLPETVNKYEDIEFSLNKKGRWALPDELRKNILHGNFQDEKYGVRLIEEHRLLKKANCISFTSSYGSVRETNRKKNKRIRRGRKRRGYFQISSILNASPANQSKKRRKGSHSPSVVETDDISTESSAQFTFPELRYEIVYPSPVTSSITHNPKYIDPSYCENSATKRRAKLRKTRTKLADIIREDLDNAEDNFDNDLSDLDEEAHIVYHESQEQREEASFQDFLFHTKKAQMLVMCSGKQRILKKENDGLDNNHLEALTNIRFETEIDNSESFVKTSNQKFAKGLKHSPLLEPVSVIIPNDDVDEWVLKNKFGKRLLECNCFPRKFVINISTEVSKLDNLRSVGKSKAELTFACVIFVHDVDNEINNEKEEVFKVYLNMPFSVKMNNVKIETIFDFAFTNVDEVIEKALFFVETLPYENFKRQKAKVIPMKSTSNSNLEECANWSSVSYRLDNKILMKMCFQDEEAVHREQTGLEQVSKMDVFSEPFDVSTPTDKFCSVCFEAVGGGVSATALMSCGHWFCDDCWKGHLVTGISEGKTRLVCPEYDCTNEIDYGTLLSLIDINHVLKYLRYCHDTDIDQKAETKWCPNSACGAVLKVPTSQVKTVSCHCGKKICFECLEESHWPAPCNAVAAYRRKVAGNGDDNLMPSRIITTVVVHGKPCPSCKRFVEKDGGCPCVSCPCGKPFCWGCGKVWYGITHGDYCYKHGYSNSHQTVPRSIQPEDYLISKIRISDRAKWYKIALEHRIQQHRVKLRNLKAPMKNLTFHLQRYLKCTEKRNEPEYFDFELPGVHYGCEAEKTRDFLQNILDLYTELHHIAEHVPIYLHSMYRGREVPPVEKLTSRMTALCVSICDLLQYGAEDNPKEVLDNLKEIRYHAKNCISGLLNFINPDNSGRTC